MHTQSQNLISRRARKAPFDWLTDAVADEMVTFVAGCIGLAAFVGIVIGICG